MDTPEPFVSRSQQRRLAIQRQGGRACASCNRRRAESELMEGTVNGVTMPFCKDAASCERAGARAYNREIDAELGLSDDA